MEYKGSHPTFGMIKLSRVSTCGCYSKRVGVNNQRLTLIPGSKTEHTKCETYSRKKVFLQKQQQKKSSLFNIINFCKQFIHFYWIIYIFFNVISSVSSDEIVFPVQEGTGQVTARMYLFRDSNYNEAYNGIPLLSTSDMLYVMIGLDGDSLSGIKLISRECWATPDVAGESSERFDIIEQPGCLKSSVNGGSITRNGDTNNARFQLPVFTFLPSNIIYLHCAVQLCTTNDCVPTCSSRRKRETNSLNVQILRSQLIIRSDDKIWDPPIVENPTDKPSDDNLTSDTLLIIIILLTITGIFLLAIIALLVYVCITRRRKIT